jgi:hypothetical protein
MAPVSIGEAALPVLALGVTAILLALTAPGQSTSEKVTAPAASTHLFSAMAYEAARQNSRGRNFIAFFRKVQASCSQSCRMKSRF